jgi:protein TonB
MEFNWPAGESFLHSETPVITVTLNYFQAEKPKPIVTTPKPLPKKIIKQQKPAIPKSKPIPKTKRDIIPLAKPKLGHIPPKMLKPKPQARQMDVRLEQEPVQIPSEATETITPVALVTSVVPRTKAPPAPVIRKAKPIYRRNPPPRYPHLARKRKYQGVVILDVFVNQDGGVGDIKVFKSSGYSILDKSALRSVRKWDFEPGKRGEKKVGMWVRTPVRFQLE